MKSSKIFKIIILTFFFVINFSNFSIASCNFKIKIGQNISKIKKFIDFNYTENSDQTKKELKNYSVSSKNICPNEFSNEELNINYTFIGNELANIKVSVNNDKDNTASNKLTLMNYVKQTYGNFDTGKNSKIYNYFNSWKINSDIIIYSRLKNQFKIIEEELFITNKNFRDKMRLINSKIEKGEIKG